MTDDLTMPLPNPPSQDPGEMLRPAKPVTPSNETVSLSPDGAVPNPATDPTLTGDAARAHAAHDGQATSRKVEPYTLVRLLVRGGMGAVWEALDTRLNRRVALKLMHSGEDATPEDLERFRRLQLRELVLSEEPLGGVKNLMLETGVQE